MAPRARTRSRSRSPATVFRVATHDGAEGTVHSEDVVFLTQAGVL